MIQTVELMSGLQLETKDNSIAAPKILTILKATW